MLSGCELVKCGYYIGGKCTDTREYVNEAGEPVCYRHDDAVPAKEYYGDTCPNCAKLQAENAKLWAVVDAARELAPASLRERPFAEMLKVITRMADALAKLEGGGDND